MTKRLEYIDAMRGFTMLLVVYSHVLTSYGDFNAATYNSAFVQFRMPLFFFISGFVLYKAERVWDSATCRSFIAKKFMVQIVPTLFFLVVFDWVFHLDVIASILSPNKYGYWFTITLFEYFLMYVATMRIFRIGGGKIGGLILCILLIFTMFASTKGIVALSPRGMREQVAILADFLNVPTFIHFPFFVFGTFVKKHYDSFRSITDNGRFMAIVLLLFLGSVLFKDDVFSMLRIPCNAMVEMFANKIAHLLTGLLGIVVVFTFFRKKENIFAQDTKLGCCLQYIGRRTLDVYMLHYFFLPRNLAMLGAFFNQNANPTIELFVSLLIATMVLCLSLCMSNVLRLSSVLEHYLFGVKRKR